jgi:tryptophan synthase alpha subunit
MRPPVTIRTMQANDPGVPFVYMTYVNPILAMGRAPCARVGRERDDRPRPSS